jgi:hypothetical protein
MTDGYALPEDDPANVTRFKAAAVIVRSDKVNG